MWSRAHSGSTLNFIQFFATGSFVFLYLDQSFHRCDFPVIIEPVTGARDGRWPAIHINPMAFHPEVSGFFCA